MAVDLLPNGDDYEVTKGWVASTVWTSWTERWLMVSRGKKRERDFFMLLRTVCNLKLMNCLFLELSI